MAWHSKVCSANQILSVSEEMGQVGVGIAVVKLGPEPSSVQTQTKIMRKQKLQGSRRSHKALKITEHTSHPLGTENISKEQKISIGEDVENWNLCAF